MIYFRNQLAININIQSKAYFFKKKYTVSIQTPLTQIENNIFLTQSTTNQF